MMYPEKQEDVSSRRLQAETLDEAVSIINANEHGNGTALFTRSGPAARKFQTEVEVGMVRCCSLRSLCDDVCAGIARRLHHFFFK